MRLQNSGHDGVGPEALCWTVLGLHLLGFGSWVWVTGIQHRLEDTPASVDEPGRRRKGGGVIVLEKYKLHLGSKMIDMDYHYH